MCWISNTNLAVGRATGSQEFARVKFRLNFSENEQKLNLAFRVYVDLYERDDTLDVYITGPGTEEELVSRGNRDDRIGRIVNTIVKPDGQPSKDLDFTRNWDFGSNESGNEEYRALVHAYPEIRRDRKWTNEVSINLG